MNRTFRTLWNPSLSTWVAAPETARGHARTSSVSSACAVAVAVIGLWGGPVLAAGGAGGVPVNQHTPFNAGSGGSSGQGGAGGFNDRDMQAYGGAGGSVSGASSTSGASADIGIFSGAIAGAGGAAGAVSTADGFGSSGQSGAAGESQTTDGRGYGGGGGAGFVGLQATSTGAVGTFTGGAGGAGGAGFYAAGGGGAGGHGITLISPSSSYTFSGSTTGGAGGKGGDAASQAGGGGGGGSGFYLSVGGVASTLDNAGAIRGGAGGAGGEGLTGLRLSSAGGGGGEGGLGVLLGGNRAVLSNTSTGVIAGGVGGAGGAGGGGAGGTGAAGSGGDGGAGVLSQGAGVSITNAGSISGGNGGAGGVNTNGGATGANGVGGAGVRGANIDITNTGTISGGMGGDGVTRAAAVQFTGGTNSLTLGGASVMVGAVAIDSAATATIRAGSANQNASSALILGGAGTFDTNGNDMTWSGPISGAAELTKTGSGALTLGGNNTYTGGTALKQGRLNVESNNALGTGELAMDDGSTLGFAADGLTISNAIRLTGTQDPVIDTGAFNATVAGAIGGAGFLTKEGAGTLTLTAANNYTGATNVAAGTLRAGAANTFSATSAHTVAAGATLDLAGFSQTVQSVTNAGTVSLVGSAPGTALTVTGPWVGNGGTLRVGTALGATGSATDRLVLRGATAIASGNTGVLVTNLGGLGGQTTGNGIEIISTENGGSIQSGAFALAAPVAAGAFVYRLDTTGTAAYLSSTVTVVPPVQPPTQPQPGVVTPAGQQAPSTPVSLSPTTAIVVPTYRNEVPLFAALPAQLRQADIAMLGNMHQRIGDVDVNTGGATAAGQRRAWGRAISTDMDIRQEGTVSPSSDGRLNGFQAGTDLWADGRWRAGVYVGQLDGNVDVTGFARGISNLPVGYNDLRSQYLGIYGTYMSETGFYADAVLQGSRHRYTVNPQSSLAVDGKGNGFLASLEVGQAFAIAPGWTIEPQLQVAHRQQSLDDAVIAGAVVSNDSENGWIMRAGVRVKGEIATGAGMLQPYARLNVYHAGSGTDVARFIGPAAFTDIVTRTGYTTTEVAVGATLQLNASTSVYGEVGQLFDSGGDQRLKSGVQGSVGLRVNW